MAAANTDALLDEIAELYAIVLRIARKIHDGDEPMTATQRLALMEITAAGPLRLRELVQRMATTPATASRAVDTLEELGFVTRKSDPNDGRGVVVTVKPRGQRWADRRAAVLRDALAQLPPAAAPDRLVRDLARLNASLRNASGATDTSGLGLLSR